MITRICTVFIEIVELEYKINLLKKELIRIAETTSLNNHETICCSQRLDQYVTIYQKLLMKKKLKNTRTINVGISSSNHNSLIVY
ncbi:Spo0E family sporulation regulatory protein-aspartic acid phosphatase [Peribacillus asahii]|uniref:Spo0E family sporulation regulatory protein-aspartic acid phosphatase n=1 Tax=Peribacillus asahii TaxID=228899 RepID=UPI00382E7930